MQKGYFIAELTVTNPEQFEQYGKQAHASVEAFGGRFLVRGGAPVLLEGDHPAGRVVILEFDSVDQAMAWYNSEQYQSALPIRLSSALTRVLCAAGA